MRVLVFSLLYYSFNWNRQLERLTFKHVDAGLSTVSHGVHEDKRKKLGEHNSHFRSNQFVSDHLCEQCSCLLPDRRVLRVAEQVEQVDQCTCEATVQVAQFMISQSLKVSVPDLILQLLWKWEGSLETFACDLMLYLLQDAKLCLGLAFSWFINSRADNMLAVVCATSQFCRGNES